MKIANSTIAMSSTHYETSYTRMETVTIEAETSKDISGAVLSLSAEAEGKTYAESMKEYQKKQEEEAARARKKFEQNAAKDMANRILESNKTDESGKLEIPDEYKLKMEMIKRLFKILRGGKEPIDSDKKNSETEDILDLRSFSFQSGEQVAMSSSSTPTISIGTNASGTTWQRVTATSGFLSESESTTFASQGLVQTADGRSISFIIEVSMSRAYMSRIDILEAEEYIKTDPLMINLDTDIGSVTDQKFLFDLDSDGDKEQISFAGNGSGFLALDKDESGTIDNGTELFGTQSGDGFKDLSEYDEDGNGWIDESDDVYSKLKVWTKDDDGNDYLFDLKKADIGAIYLGNADTQFSLKNDENKLNAEIRKTGVYLRESTGAVGTLNHVDLVV